MYIEYLGHSCFYLKGKDRSVVTDPFGDIGFTLKRAECDFVLSSHGHFDHNNFDGVKAGRIITETACGFNAIPCFHDEAHGKLRGKNKAFFFDLDGLRVLHLGDLGEPFTEENAEKFKVGADILFIPVGGNYTIDGATAAKYAKAIGAKVTVPMHYKTRFNKIDISGPQDFLSSFENFNTVENGFEITADNIENFSPVTFIKFQE